MRRIIFYICGFLLVCIFGLCIVGCGKKEEKKLDNNGSVDANSQNQTSKADIVFDGCNDFIVFPLGITNWEENGTPYINYSLEISIPREGFSSSQRGWDDLNSPYQTYITTMVSIPEIAKKYKAIHTMSVFYPSNGDKIYDLNIINGLDYDSLENANDEVNYKWYSDSKSEVVVYIPNGSPNTGSQIKINSVSISASLRNDKYEDIAINNPKAFAKSVYELVSKNVNYKGR